MIPMSKKLHNSNVSWNFELYKEVARIGEQRLITVQKVQFKIIPAMIVIVYAFEATEFE